MRKIRCDEVLKRSDFRALSEAEFKKQVLIYCNQKMAEYDVDDNKLELLKSYPKKKYEIFKIDINNEKIFLLDTNLIDYDEDEENKELYYSKAIAKKICENLKRIYEDAANGIPEVQAELQDSIAEINATIEQLKALDEEEYNMDRFIYNSIKDTTVVEDCISLENSKNLLDTENQNLKMQLKKSEETIRELTKKLKYSLEDIEKNRKELKLNNMSAFERILYKIKSFNKQ